MSLPAASKHIKVLRSTGQITKGREAQWRPCRMEGEHLKEAVDWIGEYKKIWEDRLDAC